MNQSIIKHEDTYLDDWDELRQRQHENIDRRLWFCFKWLGF